MIQKYILVGLIHCLAFATLAQKGIEFTSKSWEEALDLAQKEDKLVFVEGYVEWSEPCSILEKYTFTDEEVGAYFNENFINVRLDMEAFPGVAIADEIGITSFPALLFINKDGNIVHRGCGALETGELLYLAETAMSEDNLLTLQEKYDNGERTLDFLVQFSNALFNACMDRSWLADEYFAETERSEWMSEKSWTMLNLNVGDPYSAPFQYLMSYHDMFALKHGKDTVDTKINNVLLDQLIEIYEGGDLTLFATQALRQMLNQVDFNGKEKLSSLTNLKVSDIKGDWQTYADNAVKVVKEQEVTAPDQLNEFSWKFYLNVSDTNHLEVARDWMKEVLKDYPNATYYDTYASLSYKIGEVKDAVKYSKKALQAAEIQGEDLMYYKEQLKLFEAEQ